MGAWLPATIQRRFMERVEFEPNTGCWLWSGTTREGYGRLKIGGKAQGAHRVAYELFVGPIPPSGVSRHGTVVMHKCDTPACVNPAHLEIGSQRQNNQDRHVKGRSSGGSNAGERSPLAKIGEAEVRAIRALRLDGATVRSLARAYGLSEQQISRIVNRRRWAHI